MKTRQEIKNGILENCINDNGDINLADLDFSDFEGDIFRDRGKVKYDLGQDSNEVEGILHQDNNKVKRNLGQHNNEVKGKTFNDFDKHTEVMKGEKCYGITDFKPKPNYKDMGKEELIELLEKRDNENRTRN